LHAVRWRLGWTVLFILEQPDPAGHFRKVVKGCIGCAGIYLAGDEFFMTRSDATRPSLLVRIKDPRDREAWDQFVEIYAPVVYQMARRRGLQDADAADLTQDVLRSVSGAVGRLDYDRSKGTFRSWLYTVTRNALNTFFDAQRRWPRGTGDSAVQEWLEGRSGEEEESAAWDREYQRRLLTYAAEQVRPSFEESTWQAFWQTAVDGDGGKEVARRLGMSLGAVYIAKSRVLSRIKEHIHRLVDE
jgi:RNA polymerase sigma-70 factor (ECF subfamily)